MLRYAAGGAGGPSGAVAQGPATEPNRYASDDASMRHSASDATPAVGSRHRVLCCVGYRRPERPAAQAARLHAGEGRRRGRAQVLPAGRRGARQVRAANAVLCCAMLCAYGRRHRYVHAVKGIFRYFCTSGLNLDTKAAGVESMTQMQWLSAVRELRRLGEKQPCIFYPCTHRAPYHGPHLPHMSPRAQAPRRAADAADALAQHQRQAGSHAGTDSLRRGPQAAHSPQLTQLTQQSTA